MIEIFNGAVYNISSSADIRLKVWYEHRRSGNKMDYRFKWRMYLSYANSETPNPYAWYSNNRRITLVLNNSQVYENNSQSSSGGWDTGEITTSWYSVNNKTSGTTPFYFRALDTQNTGWMNYTSGTYQLAVDPAGSVIGSINNFELEDDITIPMTVYNSEFSNEITVKLGNTTIGTRSETITSSGDYTLTFSQNELNAIYQLYTDSNLQKEFTFELKTYNVDANDNRTQVGETSTTTATGILTDCSPVLDVPVSTSITSPVQIPADTVIKNISYIMFGVSAHSKKYARISSVKVNNNYLSKVSESTTGGEHYVIYNGSILANTNVYYYTVADNRSQAISGQKTFSVINYVPLTINANFERLNSTSNSIKLTYSGNFWAGNFGNGTSGYQDNTITLNWYYKLSTDTNWTSGGSLTPTISSQNNTYSGSLTLSGTYNYDKDYDFKIEYSDLVTTTKEFKQTVIKGLGILELYKTTALINGDLDVTGHNTILEVSPIEPTNKAKTWIQYSQNIFDGVLELGQYNMANGTKQSSTSLYRCANKVPVLPNTKYTISINGVAHQYFMFYYKQDESFINYGDNRTGTFTTPSNCYYITFRCYATDYVSNYSSLKIQIEKGENATPYTEYEPDTSINVYNGNEYVEIPTGKDSLNNYSTSQTESYSCDFINGKVLYSNSSGDNGTIQLSESVANYNSLVIHYRTIDYFYNSTYIDDTPNNKKITLLGLYGKANETAVFIKSRTIEIVNDTISTYDNQYQETCVTTGGNVLANNNHIFITKVVGYKY
jgi:hypothetical protein